MNDIALVYVFLKLAMIEDISKDDHGSSTWSNLSSNKNVLLQELIVFHGLTYVVSIAGGPSDGWNSQVLKLL